MTKQQHTAGPFRAEPTPSSDLVTRRIFAIREDGPDIAIAEVGVPQRSNLDVHTEAANADFIVTAMNNHHRMLGVLTKLIEWHGPRISGSEVDEARAIVAELGKLNG